MIKKISLLLLAITVLFFSTNAQSSFGTLKGRVTDSETGEELPFSNVVIMQNGVQKGGASTNMDGYYIIKPIPAGTYDVVATYVGYHKVMVKGYVIGSNKISFQNIKMHLKGLKVEEIEIIVYSKPLVEKDEGSGGRLSKKEIEKAPTRSVGELVDLTAGVTGGSVKGQRTSGTVYYVDGVKVRGFTGIPQGSIQEINTMTGGIPAQYGDLVGGVVSITTRGPSQKFAGGAEIVTSEGLDPFGYNTFEGNISGPLVTKYKGTDSVTTKLGFLLSSNVNFRKDPSPTPDGVWKIKDDVYDYLLANPLSPSPNGIGFVPSAEYLTKDDMEKVNTHVGIPSFSYNVNLKLDFQPVENVNITAGGQAGHSKGHGYNYYHSLFNYENAAQQLIIRNTYRGYLRFTQRFKNKKVSKKEALSKENQKKFKISNAYYTLMVDYTKQYNYNHHEVHKDNYFDYGYVGKFESYSRPVYYYDYDTVNGHVEQANVLLGYQDTLVKFTPSDKNNFAGYTSQLFDLQEKVYNFTQIQQYGGLRNGDGPGNVYSLWANIASPATGYGIYDEDQIRVSGKASADLNNHEISFGFEYEQREQNYYGVGANSLWTAMRQSMNAHILQLDTDNPIPIYSDDGVFLDTINYNRLNDGSQSTFDKNFREYLMSKGATDVYGNPIDNLTYVNIDRYSPDEFSLDMFSADELLQQGYVGYYGFDYLGNKVNKKITIDDFLNSDERLIAPINPIYMAGYIQDKFAFKDMIFRIGLRIDRFDANQVVLKDKYSLYPSRTVSEVKIIDPDLGNFPGNIGDDYVVYVDDPFNPTEILGFRDGDYWYDATGSEVTDPNILAMETSTGTIAPYLVEDNEEELKLTKESFKDYEPQINLSPRIYFSFPISDEANFFATYDIRVQRPTSGLFTSIDDYYFMEQRGTATLNNAALKPQSITSYELGFKQAISKNSAVQLNAYYNETRDQINVRMINQAYPRTYMTYDNIDFQTTKGFSFTYDLRRSKVNNVQMLTSYTLQFSNGTGSSAASQAGLISAGQPNLRTPFPLSNDYRHVLSASIDYRYKGGKMYNGPVTKNGKKLFEYTGVNFMVSTRSGRPYSKQGNVTQAVGVGIRQSATLKGTMNGSRYPWTYNVNMKIDRDFFFMKKEKDSKKTFNRGMYLNVYVWVQNLLNIRNINYIYRYTGDPTDDGFLSSSNGIKAVEEATLSQAFYDQYSLKVNSPSNYSLPRLIRLGATLNF
ncbi:MAG: carboxypeptidase-like regulatory domain-containing protein [Bacteroidota bacterium]|nr:carboxypeptidase-like regulatory domain-containing protein [Bacteroidota bacterium]